jgi:NAD(P)-dependent dehydrogenase (short-subunit alcohol dehydrogenase family)
MAGVGVLLEQRSGAIVNISSMAGIHGVQGGAPYSAAKAALQMFTTVTAAEWGRHGIRVNCLAVGGIASPRAEAAWRAGGIDAATIGAAVPIGRPGISGQTLAVDGGPVMSGG